MPLESHALHREFPEFSDLIHELKSSDAHFRRLFDAYHEATKKVEHIEAEGSNTSDEFLEGCKKQRLALKDELYVILKNKAA